MLGVRGKTRRNRGGEPVVPGRRLRLPLIIVAPGREPASADAHVAGVEPVVGRAINAEIDRLADVAARHIIFKGDAPGVGSRGRSQGERGEVAGENSTSSRPSIPGRRRRGRHDVHKLGTLERSRKHLHRAEMGTCSRLGISIGTTRKNLQKAVTGISGKFVYYTHDHMAWRSELQWRRLSHRSLLG